MLIEEVHEISEAETWSEQVDGFCDVIQLASGALMKLGLNVEDAMGEMLKEIESRLQDPEQKQRWMMEGSNGEKWQKWKDQPEDTLYKADYEKLRQCKVVL